MKRLLITAASSLVVGLVIGMIIGHRMDPSQEQVAHYFSKLSVGDIPEVAKRLNSQLGFQLLPSRFIPGSTAPAEPSK
jgi:hypothetical protein